MKRRIFWSIMLTSLLVLALTITVVMVTVYREFETERKTEIKTETAYIAEAYVQGNTDYLREIGRQSKNRITLVASDGRVIYDSFADASELENHLDRPEIALAIKNGTGEEIRNSNTLSAVTYYYAQRLEDGNILRVAATMKSITDVIDNTGTYIALVAVFAVILAVLAAQVLTRRIVAPINGIDPEHPLAGACYDELSPLLVRMDKQNEKISAQMSELYSKQREFTEITDGMNEALVIFGTDKKVLSANKSAKALFAEHTPDGVGYLELCRDIPYIEAVEAAFGGRNATGKLTRGGRVYRISVNPVNANGNYALVLFAVDITSSEHAEQMRREFSANVSHELKTPLTSILGCAEIMYNGVAKSEDFPHFTKQIYDEAKRLLSLIEDIIRLSKLDEGEFKREFSDVDLFAVSAKAVSELTAKAQAAGVTMALTGTHLFANGIENTIHEMIFNLCDNAIVYNRSGGSVNVDVSESTDGISVTVKDTGIGIAPENQDRIFERFFRVDKSHSKETGGTGLGLSIVKHGAILHGASIKLSSTLGKGSEISIIFPR